MGIKEIVAAPLSAGVAERQASALCDDSDDNKRQKSGPGSGEASAARDGGEWIARIIVLSAALELSFCRQEFENENARSSVGSNSCTCVWPLILSST